MTDKTELEVTQADREAAADLWINVDGDAPTRAILHEADRYRFGHYDHTPAVQAFARHRLATRAPDPTPVAWMYQCGRSRIVKENDDLGLSGYTKTPLYAHPPADGLVEACIGISDDYMTSETHHPGYVLIPTEQFNAITQALAVYRGEA